MTTREILDMEQSLLATAKYLRSVEKSTSRMAAMCAFFAKRRTLMKEQKKKSVLSTLSAAEDGHSEEAVDRFWLILQREVLGLDEEFQPIDDKVGLLENLGKWTQKNGLDDPESVMTMCQYGGTGEVDYGIVLKSIFACCETTDRIQTYIRNLLEAVEKLIPIESKCERLELECEPQEEGTRKRRRKNVEQDDEEIEADKYRKKLAVVSEQKSVIEGFIVKLLGQFFEELTGDSLFQVDIQQSEKEDKKKKSA